MINLASRASGFAALLLLSAARVALAQAPTPPFNQCPAVGHNTGCSVLITFQKDGKPRVDTDPSQGPYDAIEDTTVGVQNNSNRKVFSIRLKGSTIIFGFDGDGICGNDPNTGQPFNPRPGGCPFGPTGYEGPGVSFANISSDLTQGTVNFAAGIASGGSAYFSLEESNFQLALCGTDDPSTTEPIGGATNCPPLGTKSPTWGSFGSRSALVSDIGEKLELICEGPNGFLPSYHLYYTAPGGTPFRVGTCPFVGGCNNGTFTYAGKNPTTGNPKCFVGTYWRSRDYEDNDVPNPWTQANGTDTTAHEPVLDWAITTYDAVTNNVTKSDVEYKYNPAVTPPIPPVPNATFCSGIPPAPAEGAFVRTVPLADPSLGPITEAFFARVDQFLQQIAFPGAPPMVYGIASLADLNVDGAVDAADFEILRSAFGSCSGEANYNPRADFDNDQCVTFKDFRLFLQLLQSAQGR